MQAVSEVLALLDAERDERGIGNWEKLGANTAGMKSYGIGLTRRRKLAKRIGRNRKLAQALCEPFDVVKHVTTDRLKEKLLGAS
jgi:hypothetical protein